MAFPSIRPASPEKICKQRPAGTGLAPARLWEDDGSAIWYFTCPIRKRIHQSDSIRRRGRTMRFTLVIALSSWASLAMVGTTHADEPIVSSTSEICVPYTIQITLQGVQRQAIGHACPQTDGSWRVLQDAVIPAIAAQGTSQSSPAC